MHSQVKCVWKMNTMMMIMSKREKKKQQVETLRSFAKNKRKIMLKYSCLSLCVYMYVCMCVDTGGGTHEFHSKSFLEETSAKQKAI